jgi:Uncharacterized protein conserved in bacteria
MESKLTVKIFGQEYTISGDKTEEEIKKIAEYVDNKMHLISRVAGDTAAGSIAVLTAVNIAEEYFDAVDQSERLNTSKTQLENDSKYYLKMWEDAKKNSVQFKDTVADLRNQIKEKDEKVREAEDKCTEYENSFFDIQMENIQLKSELEKLKNNQ